jgi:hypothetical protein
MILSKYDEGNFLEEKMRKCALFSTFKVMVLKQNRGDEH